MKVLYIVVLSFLLCINAIAQETETVELKSEQELMNERVGNLAALTSELITQVDSLKRLVVGLQNEIERSKWNQIEMGMSTEKVINILGASTKIEEASFGYKKLIFGEGYSGYVLFDKEMNSADWSPPLHLRLKMNN